MIEAFNDIIENCDRFNLKPLLKDLGETLCQQMAKNLTMPLDEQNECMINNIGGMLQPTIIRGENDVTDKIKNEAFNLVE